METGQTVVGPSGVMRPGTLRKRHPLAVPLSTRRSCLADVRVAPMLHPRAEVQLHAHAGTYSKSYAQGVPGELHEPRPCRMDISSTHNVALILLHAAHCLEHC